MNKIIQELQKRKNLGEGRNFGIGFSILQKTKKGFDTYLPFTACRDYLNDFSYVEYEKKEIGSIYGYHHKLLNCFDNQDFFYIGIRSLHYLTGREWGLFNKSNLLINNNYKNLQKFLNKIEKQFKLKTKTKIMLNDDNTLIIKVPIFWSKYSFLISLYTLYIRIFININPEFKFSKLIDSIKTHTPIIASDLFYVPICERAIKNVNKILEIIPDFKYENKNPEILSKDIIHSYGIKYFLDIYNLN